MAVSLLAGQVFTFYRWSRNVAKISEAGKVNSAPVETWDGMSDRKHVL